MFFDNFYFNVLPNVIYNFFNARNGSGFKKHLAYGIVSLVLFPWINHKLFQATYGVPGGPEPVAGSDPWPGSQTIPNYAPLKEKWNKCVFTCPVCGKVKEIFFLRSIIGLPFKGCTM